MATRPANPQHPTAPAAIRLGLRENLAQFSLLVLINAFVGAMVGLERSILPAIAEQDFQLAARTAMLSFIVVFGGAKALTNYGTGRLSDRWGRKHLLVAGWLIAVPVPFILMWAPTWTWVLVANGLLGISQGLTWSTTIIMKIDLVGLRQRGLAMGLNEFSGYLALATTALATGWIAARYGLRPQPFYLGVGFAIIGLGLSALFVRETRHHVSHEAALIGTLPHGGVPTARQVFWRTTVSDANLSSVSQAGLVNNLNDGMAWGLFPLVFAAAGMDLVQVGLLAAIYPATWGVAQLVTGALSDRTGRKPLIVWGMWVQSAGIGGSRNHSRRSSSVPCCSGSAPPWLTRRCLRRLATSRIRRGAHPPSASIACGGILAMPLARCSRESRLTLSVWPRPCGSSPC